MNNLLLKLEEIVNQLKNDFPKDEGISLMSGKTGLALFWNTYAYASKDIQAYKQSEYVLNEIEKSIEFENQYSFCSGFAGIGWFYQYMNDMGIFDNDTNYLLEDFDNYLCKMMKAILKQGNTDFLHEATGIAYYFYCRYKDNKNANVCLQKYVDEISRLVIIDGDLIKLPTKDFKTHETILNISLSHGMSAVVSVLARIYTIEDLRSDKLKQLIEGMVNYILAQEIDVEKYGSFFPYTSIESAKPLEGSRLAWCYGDLGVCCALYQVGKIMNRQDWIDKAISVLVYAAKNRRDLNDNFVLDACMCHGTVSIAHIFYRMWWNTHMDLFKDTAKYWFDKTLEMASFEDGLAGYKTWRGSDNAYDSEYGLLDGVVGIGLALTSYTYETEPTWDQCLLLS